MWVGRGRWEKMGDRSDLMPEVNRPYAIPFIGMGKESWHSKSSLINQSLMKPWALRCFYIRKE